MGFTQRKVRRLLSKP